MCLYWSIRKEAPVSLLQQSVTPTAYIRCYTSTVYRSTCCFQSAGSRSAEYVSARDSLYGVTRARYTDLHAVSSLQGLGARSMFLLETFSLLVYPA